MRVREMSLGGIENGLLVGKMSGDVVEVGMTVNIMAIAVADTVVVLVDTTVVPDTVPKEGEVDTETTSQICDDSDRLL